MILNETILKKIVSDITSIYHDNIYIKEIETTDEKLISDFFIEDYYMKNFKWEDNKFNEWVLESLNIDGRKKNIFYKIVSDNNVIGILNINLKKYRDFKCSIYCYIDKKYRKNHIAHNILIILFNLLFNKYGYNRIDIDLINNNKVAHNLSKKLGMIKELVRKEKYKNNNIYYDVFTFSILKDEWRSKNE